jgi:hypothetical protein
MRSMRLRACGKCVCARLLRVSPSRNVLRRALQSVQSTGSPAGATPRVTALWSTSMPCTPGMSSVRGSADHYEEIPSEDDVHFTGDFASMPVWPLYDYAAVFL